MHLHSSTLRDVLLWANFVRNDLPTNHTSSNFARVTAVNGYSSEIPNHQGIFYVHPELTHGSSLGSVSCRFTSISDRTGTHVGTCMHTRLHVEIAPILIPAQFDSSDTDTDSNQPLRDSLHDHIISFSPFVSVWNMIADSSRCKHRPLQGLEPPHWFSFSTFHPSDFGLPVPRLRPFGHAAHSE